MQTKISGASKSPLLAFLLFLALRHFRKWITDAASAIHGYEALLAIFSILLWHFYMVIFDPLVYPMDTAWLDGKVPADHYRHSRPAYLRVLEHAGLVVSSDGEAPAPEKTDSVTKREIADKSASQREKR